MKKKTDCNDVARLTAAIRRIPNLPPPRKKKATNPKGGNPPEQYRFQPGQSGNPGGKPRDYAILLSARMTHSCPPRQLCEQLGIDPRVSWGEAILITLGRAAMLGDVSAAREVLAALGLNGAAARTNVLVNVENLEQRGLTFEFLRHAHGISAGDMNKVWAFMDALPKEAALVVDGSYFPDESYREQVPTVAPPLLSEQNRGEAE